ncbi:MAG: hypothetical protein JNN15_08565, partial [Blastocatellia bacterium]|nr:hypothetical protein [Blastocatellia bacterium]
MSDIDDKNNSPTQGSQELVEAVSVRIPREVREVPVTLKRSSTTTTADLPLWVVIRKATEALSFDNYNRFLDLVFSEPNPPGSPNGGKEIFDKLKTLRFLPYNDSDAYRLLKVATEAFLMVNCGVASADYGSEKHPFTDSDTKIIKDRVGVDIPKAELGSVWNEYLADLNGTQNQIVPYLALIRDKLRDSVLIEKEVTDLLKKMGREDKSKEYIGILRSKLTKPCLLELIWSYWHEEGMLVQTMNALSLRFQNIRGNGLRDPLAMLEIDPLRPLNNLIWSYIQDEQHRLTVVRRAYEYNHHYGITLYGKAVPTLRPADSRSKFIEAFHNLLYLATVFFKEDDDTTVIADGFPLLNALKEVHLVLSESAHNQYGDLPSTSRIEMLMQQWILARPE